MKYSWIIFMAALFVAFSTFAVAAQDWEAGLKVQVGPAKNQLSFGQMADATDDIDGQYDVAAMLKGQVQAYFQESGKKLWRDIKRIDNGWDLVVESSRIGETVTLSWTGALLPEGGQTLLHDMTTGKTIDMASNSTYSYVNRGARTLRIELN